MKGKIIKEVIPELGVFDVCDLMNPSGSLPIFNHLEEKKFVVLLLCDHLRKKIVLDKRGRRIPLDAFAALVVTFNGTGPVEFAKQFHRNCDVVSNSQIAPKIFLEIIGCLENSSAIKFWSDVSTKWGEYQIRGMEQVLQKEVNQKNIVESN